jgi:hypothetical protein
VERWHSPPSGLFMIVMKSSGDYRWPWAGANSEQTAEASFRATYPSLHRHFKAHEDRLHARQDKGRFWWELRSCSYYQAFQNDKIIYPDLSWSPKFIVATNEEFINDLNFMIPSADYWVASVLNSPSSWYFLWRHAIHGKDEVLRLKSIYMETMPIPKSAGDVSQHVLDISRNSDHVQKANSSILDWLHYQFGLEKPGRALSDPHTLDAESFVEAVKAALPKRRRLSAADIGELKREHAATIAPARTAAVDVLRLERRLSDLVNQAYGLTPDDIRLMWETAPPRMPLNPADELARLARGG